MSRLTIICVALGMILFSGCKKDDSAGDPGMHAGGPPPLRTTDQLRPEPATTETATAPKTVEVAPTPAEPASAQPIAPAPQPVARTHTLLKDDTLWSLATKYLGDGKRWPEFVALNPGLEPKTLTVGRIVNIPAK